MNGSIKLFSKINETATIKTFGSTKLNKREEKSLCKD